jgi:phage FluMu gp28-like protein
MYDYIFSAQRKRPITEPVFVLVLKRNGRLDYWHSDSRKDRDDTSCCWQLNGLDGTARREQVLYHINIYPVNARETVVPFALKTTPKN